MLRIISISLFCIIFQFNLQVFCSADERLNILIIAVDGLRPDHLSCYGYDKSTTPNIDKLAKEGVLFPNAISQGNWTSPGLLSILTSLYPATHGDISGDQDERFGLSEDGSKKFTFKTPGQILKENGYALYAVSQNYPNTGLESSGKGILQTIEDCKDKKFFIFYYDTVAHNPYNPASPYNTMFLPDRYIVSKDTLSRMDIARVNMVITSSAFYEKVDKKAMPFVKRADFTKDDRALLTAFYDGEHRLQDDELGEILKKLEETKLIDNTIIVITADHGEELLERGHLSHASDSLEGSLYDELIKIPIIMRYPKAIPKDIVLENQVQQIDIMPTIFDILGLKIPRDFQGKSLLKLIQGKTSSFYEDAFSMSPPCGSSAYRAMPNDMRMIYSVREDRYKLIWNYSPEEDRYELYDLNKDPHEARNIVKEKQEVYERLKAKLKKHLDDCKKLREGLFQ